MIIDHPTAADLPALRTLWREAFGDTEEFLDAFAATGLCAQRCLTAKLEDRLAAALYWFDCTCRGKKVAYIYAVATAGDFRGRGICHALMEQLHKLLSRRGYAGSLLKPGGEGLVAFYEGMGYRTFCGMTDFLCAAAGEPTPLHPIDAEEYGRLRPAFLPEGAVVQENENLDFLATQCSFYSGPGFLLAARKEEQRLMGLELLGDAQAAPGILMALGCAEGTFRRFGEGAPFGMYRPLTDAPAPTYFALAFD